jgi:hypothetical protein
MRKKTILVGILLAAITTLSVPMAANAESEAPGSTCTLSQSTVTSGGGSDFSSVAGTFGASENVHIVVTGNNTSKATTVTSSPSGAASANVSAPAATTGAYQIKATGMTSGDVCTTTLTVYNQTNPTDPSDPSVAGGTTGSGLADTGSTISTTAMWAAGGVVALGALLLAAVSIIRRRATSTRR